MAFVPSFPSHTFIITRPPSHAQTCPPFTPFPFVRRHRRALSACTKSTTPTSASEGAPRRRGRPRKNPPRESSTPSAQFDGAQKPKRRGRPRKNPTPEAAAPPPEKPEEHLPRRALNRGNVSREARGTASPTDTNASAPGNAAATAAATVAAGEQLLEGTSHAPAAPFTQAEKMVLSHTPFSDGRYGSCCVCGDPVAIPGLDSFFCGRCGWVRRPVETETIAPGHHD